MERSAAAANRQAGCTGILRSWILCHIILIVILSHCIMHAVPSCRRRAREGNPLPPPPSSFPFPLHPCASPRRAQRHSTRGVQYLLRTVAQYAARPVKNIAFHARHEGGTMPMPMHQRTVKRALASFSALCYSLCLSSQWTTSVWRTGAAVPPPDHFSPGRLPLPNRPHRLSEESVRRARKSIFFFS